MQRRLVFFAAVAALFSNRGKAQLPSSLPRLITNRVLVPQEPGSLSYSLPVLPVSGTLAVYLNGLRQTPGVDYNQSGATITFAAPYRGMTPAPMVLVDYWAI